MAGIAPNQIVMKGRGCVKSVTTKFLTAFKTMSFFKILSKKGISVTCTQIKEYV